MAPRPRLPDPECTDHASGPPAALPLMLERALSRTLGDVPCMLLAISGGLDSMALLHAVARWRSDTQRVVVATFDHGTGTAARKAVREVQRRARALGLSVTTGRIARPARSEEGWREARWRFLQAAAHRVRGVVVTAHTRDDQIETVAMRILRGAGARGLAGLEAPSPVRRPWLGVSRRRLARWVEAEGLSYVTDPTNRSRAHLRNRVRLDLLPALVRTPAGADLRRELLEIGRRAARWRREVERVVNGLVDAGPEPGTIAVVRSGLEGYSVDEAAILWPALAARAGVRLDRRGTRRLSTFTSSGPRLGRVPLSGGAEVLATPGHFIIRGRSAAPAEERPLTRALSLPGWRFRQWSGSLADKGLWSAALPSDALLTVRSWQPADRIQRPGGETARRVKRYFREAGVPGPLRTGWPVVLADGVIVWIPGVCRSDAATERPGRPTVTYLCERTRR